MSGRLLTNEGLKPGDVLQVSTQHTKGKETFWWKRFAVVLREPQAGHYRVNIMNLKLHPRETDFRLIDLREAVAYKIEEPWPQGVTAMHMKLVMTGAIQLGEDN
jgi:hypothetical protein